MNCNAWKLTRVEPREKPRTDWPERWQAAGDSVNWQGALKDEFIALKTSPIWRALGQGVGGFDDATQSDSPPFAINSGMGWLGVDFQPQSKIQNPQSKIQNPQSKIQNPQSKIQNRKLSIANEKGNPMPQPNKVNLILLIAQRFTDDMCANVLERFDNHPLLIANKLVNEAANWDEDLHPRHNDGKFAPKGQGEERAYSEEEIDENRRKWHQHVEDAKKLRRRKPGSGYTLDEYDQLELDEIDKIRDVFEIPSWKSDQNGNWRPSPKMKRVLDLVKRIDKIREIDRENAKKAKGEANRARYDRYNEIDDELTRMVETYGTDGLTGRIKKDGTSADKKTREAYRQLQREQKKLERQIDWQALDDEPDVDDSTRSLEDDNYRPDDPPSRTPEAADEADREMFREWTKNIPREKWTKDMQAEYKRLFGKK